MPPQPELFLPLKDLTFRILLALSEAERHGADLAKALEEDGRSRVLPGHLYRTLDRMLADRLIEERGRPADHATPPGQRGTVPTRFFRLTPLGVDVAREETTRLEKLVARSRRSRLLRSR